MISLSVSVKYEDARYLVFAGDICNRCSVAIRWRYQRFHARFNHRNILYSVIKRKPARTRSSVVFSFGMFEIFRSVLVEERIIVTER